MPQVKRGKQDAVNMQRFQLTKSDNKKITQLANLNLKSNFEITIFNKKGEVTEKTCTIDFIRVDSKGQGDTVVATAEVNLAMHLGSAYAEQTVNMEPTSAGRAFGLQITQVRFIAAIEASTEKDKYAETFQTCVAWRQQQGPPKPDNMTDDPEVRATGGSMVNVTESSSSLINDAEPERRGTEVR